MQFNLCGYNVIKHCIIIIINTEYSDILDKVFQMGNCTN